MYYDFNGDLPDKVSVKRSRLLSTIKHELKKLSKNE